MLPKGTMTVEILPDGTLKIESGDMGGTSHKAADQFHADVQRAMGGPVNETKVKHTHIHTHHQHDHGHTHEH